MSTYIDHVVLTLIKVGLKFTLLILSRTLIAINMHHIGNDKFVTVSLWNGEPKVHIRQYFNTADDPKNQGPGKMIPTKKGIALSISEWKELKKWITAVDLDVNSIYTTEEYRTPPPQLAAASYAQNSQAYNY